MRKGEYKHLHICFLKPLRPAPYLFFSFILLAKKNPSQTGRTFAINKENLNSSFN